jgi:hypothetical protein
LVAGHVEDLLVGLKTGLNSEPQNVQCRMLNVEGMNRRAISINEIMAEFHPSTFFGSLFAIHHSLFQIEPQNVQCRISNVEGMNRRAMSV